ncbi:MAG: BlaI/MecI/CopY family transcriptional regulator [Deferribacteres bacterium]|nr:BlaI/MecI/CopY family transcriptional regulator [candidate division KSB1 bacterium]MCB9512163.1 BlaI/MecI/CopY family transcriptional regulator [Deferribacteres bacterium]
MSAKSKQHPDLSKAEYDILRVLWKSKRLSVREVHDQLQPVTKWAYSTTKTMMDRMVKKGLLLRESFHGLFLYRPLISRPAGLVKMVQFFADRVLEMDYGSVVSLFARSHALSQEEIDELEQFLETESKKGGKE